MRICIDLDGVICQLKRENQTYSDVKVLSLAAEKIRDLRSKGHYVIIATARHMKTCGGDQGLVVARVGKITIDWLAANEIEYDELYFGKPYAHIYIDDNAFRFTSWDNVEIGDREQILVDNERLYIG